MAKKCMGCLKQQKMSRQKAKLLMRSGGELEDMMLGSLVEKFRKGGKAKRNVKSKERDEEYMQEYKLGGWTHSGKKK